MRPGVAGVIGFFAGAGLMGFGVYRLNANMDHSIIMPDKEFIASRDYLTFGGRIVGDQVGYPNNALRAFCSKDDMVCHVTTVEQIGDNQIGTVEESEYKIARWNDYEMVAMEEGLCANTILNATFHDESVEYVVNPINQTQKICENSDVKLHKWSLGKSLFWQKMEDSSKKT